MAAHPLSTHGHGNDDLDRLGKERTAQDLVGFQVFSLHTVTFGTDSHMGLQRFWPDRTENLGVGLLKVTTR